MSDPKSWYDGNFSVHPSYHYPFGSAAWQGAMDREKEEQNRRAAYSAPSHVRKPVAAAAATSDVGFTPEEPVDWLQLIGEIMNAVCVGVLALLLAGCSAQASAEPSAADIRQVMVQAEVSNPDMMRWDQALLDAQDHVHGGQERRLVDVLVADKGQCVPATNASGFVCDIRTGVPSLCPANPSTPDNSNSGGDLAVPDTSVSSADASPNDATPGTQAAPAPVQAASCNTDVKFSPWRKLRFFQADGQWQVAAAD